MVTLRVATVSSLLVHFTRSIGSDLDNLTSKDFLFGCENKTDEFNEYLFLKVHAFLINKKGGKYQESIQI